MAEWKHTVVQYTKVFELRDGPVERVLNKNVMVSTDGARLERRGVGREMQWRCSYSDAYAAFEIEIVPPRAREVGQPQGPPPHYDPDDETFCVMLGLALQKASSLGTLGAVDMPRIREIGRNIEGALLAWPEDHFNTPRAKRVLLDMRGWKRWDPSESDCILKIGTPPR